MRKSSREKHSFIQFYFDDWKAGTAHMTRLVRSIYFDICLYNWDKRKPVPPTTLLIMLGDIDNAGQIIDALVAEGTLHADDGGAIFSPRAIREGERAFDAWAAKSRGGRNSVKSGDKIESVTTELEESSEECSNSADDIEPDSDSEPDSEERGKESPLPPLPVGPAEVAQAWNDMAATCGLSHIKVMTDERQKRLGARIAEHGAQAIIDGIQQIPHIGFMLGDNDRGWKANFDFLLVPKNCTKLLEGGYAAGNGRRSGWVGD